MATHRLQDTEFSPEWAFPLTLDVLDAAENLTAQRCPALPQLQAALTQVTRWREQVLTRDRLAHRRQLLTLRTQYRGRTEPLERRCCVSDREGA